MSRYWSPPVHSLNPYTPGEQPKLTHLVKLNTNENPYPPSPRVAAAIRREIGEDGLALRLYPDPHADCLKQAVIEYFAEFELTPEQVFVGGNGSDEVLALVFMALLRHELPILLPDVSYSFYPVYCGLYGIEHTAIPLDEHFAVRVDDYARENGGIVVANPNAPTGLLLSLADIERLAAASSRSVVVIDEAYIDFGGETAIGLTRRFANLLVVRTLSKSHALAGLRIGYAIGDPALIEALERVKNCFNSYPLDRLAIVGAAAAISDREYLEETRQAVIRSRTLLVGRLELLGFEVLPSAANFVFVRHPQRDAAELAGELRQRSIIVRHFRQPQRIDQYLRITVGTDAQCDLLVTALEEFLQPTSNY
jgi:histidinol-phosphate aminotransferase